MLNNNILPQYNPKQTEDKWYQFWEENKLFSAKPNPSLPGRQTGKKPFSIVIPPPNVTGILHMGHALNNTIQDILIRYHRMKGEESLWMPGTDHAGIATQNVVERQIAKEGLRRQDLGREKFLGRVWQWKEEYGSTIIRQLKKLGSSCDWSRTRFTMDDEYSKAVTEVFVRLYEEGLIYQGNYIINWCPRCQTALSDEEAPHQEIEANLYYIKYPFKGQSPSGTVPYIVVATTRPETMLGDTAVAVNPKDKRYKKFLDEILILPLINREIKIIADDMVDMKFGTGAVKVTPAHDPKDYILAKKHKLEFINIFHPDGRLNEHAGRYKDTDRFEAREAILKDLKEMGLLGKIEPHKLSAGHCYRCHTIIEPYLSKQWFVKMKPLAKPAMEVVKKGKIKFYPKRWMKVYLNWMENIQDWCISRQIWWGHRLPVYYCKNCQAGKSEILNPKSETNLKSKIQNQKLATGIIVSRTKPGKCLICGSTDIYQDEDVLDTWFSSWLWPFATFYWPQLEGLSPKGTVPKEDLDYFYPTSVLVTAPEIIFFWVARMIMAGLKFTGEIPFRDVYIHGTVRDIEGRKMSKSLGNIIDPLDLIEHIGADALRFSLISITATGQDVFLSEEKFRKGRNFANKIWNATRLILMNLELHNMEVDLCVFYKKESLNLANRWILSRFYSTLKDVSKALVSYNLNDAANLLYQFFWHEFCDWYLEMIKPEIKHPHNQLVMYKILEKFLRALHPFMPFITEEIWQKLSHKGKSIMVETWPHIQEDIIDKKVEQEMELALRLISSIRNITAELKIPLDKKIDIILLPKTKERRAILEETLPYLKRLARLEKVEFCAKPPLSKSKISLLIDGISVFIPIEGLIDLEKELTRIKNQINEINLQIEGKEKQFKNKDFIQNAPPQLVEGEREKLSELKERRAMLEKFSHEIKGA